MASARQFLSQIRGRYPHTDTEDVITMINALARVWAEAKGGGTATKRDYRFAAQVFCVLAAPKQPVGLPSQIAHMAATYAGIAHDAKLYDKFRQSISIGMLSTCKDSSAVLSELAKNGVEGLFRY